MLWDASSISGYAIEASDGRVGIVADLLIEDVDWSIRWLIVDTGNWLSGRKVLLPLSALGQPDPALRKFPVKLNMQQVKDSPDIDTNMPVSRQMESDVIDYYSGGPYWGDGLIPMSNAIATPLVAPLYSLRSNPNDSGDAGASLKRNDPHLRSIAAMTGYHIHASDGEIGHVKDFLVEVDGWRIRYIMIDTNDWWPGEKVLISPFSVQEINWAERQIQLNVKRQQVKDAPPYNAVTTVDGAYNEKFLTYYGIEWVEA